MTSAHREINLIVEWLLHCYDVSKLRKEHKALTAQTCPKCGNKMVNLGLNGVRYHTDPVKREIWHACDNCKVIKETIEDDGAPIPFGGRNLKEYKFL